MANSSMLVLPSGTSPAARDAGDDGRVEGRHVALEDARTARGRHVGRDQHVLDRERHAGERSELLACRTARVDVGGDVERVVAHVQEGVDVAVHRRDAVEVRLRRLDAGDLARGELGGELGSGQTDQIGPLTAPPPGSR